jgi:Predicted periplasmic solute-binding protein
MNRKLTVILLSVVLFAALLIYIYLGYFQPNTSFTEKSKFVYISTGSVFADVVKYFKDSSIVKNISSFEKKAIDMNYNQKILPGRYTIEKGMSNYQIIKLLKSGKQTPVPRCHQ